MSYRRDLREIAAQSADEYEAWQETAYLFRSPPNARRLLDAYERARARQTEVHQLDRDE